MSCCHCNPLDPCFGVADVMEALRGRLRLVVKILNGRKTLSLEACMYPRSPDGTLLEKRWEQICAEDIDKEEPSETQL